MNTKSTITVLMIAILLGAYFLLFETDMIHKNPTSGTDNTGIIHNPSGTPLFSKPLLPAQVNQLTIMLPGHTPFVVTRDSQGAPQADWKQTAPFPYPMTDWKIDELVTHALKLHYTSRIKPTDLSTYDLKSPQATLALKTDQGEHELRFGAIAPAGGAYLMFDDQTDVYVVDAALHELLLGKVPSEFRTSSLPHIPFGQVQQIALQRDDLSVTLQRMAGESSDWFFLHGASGRASGESVESVVNTINFAAIEKFIADQPDDLTRFGLNQPQITLRVTQSQPAASDKTPPTPTTYTLRIGSPTDLNDTAYFAMFDDSPVIFTLAKSSIDRLTLPLNELRDARLTPAQQADLRELTVTHAGDNSPTVHLAKSEGRWLFADPKPAYELEPASVDQLLHAIFQTKATEYIDMSQSHDMHELARISLTSAGSSHPDELTIYDHAAGSVMVRRNNEPVGYVAARSALSAALNDKLFYRDRTVIDFKPAEIVSIRVERTGKFPAVYNIQRGASGQFDLKGLDFDAVQSLIKAITPLRASDWRSGVIESKGADEIITLTAKDVATYTIELFRDRSAGRSGAGDFSLNAPTIDALFAELRDRVVIPLDVNQIATVVCNGTTITRDANGQITAEGASINSQQAGKLLDALAGLKAEHFIPEQSVKMDIHHPAHTLTLTPRQGEPLVLSVWLPQQNDYNSIIGRINDGPLFTLTDHPMKSILPAQ